MGRKPLTNSETGSSQFWALEAHTGRLVHEGDTTEALFIVKEKEVVRVEYDARARTLAFGRNEEPLMMAFEGVGMEGEDLYPLVLFNRRTTSKVRVYSIYRVHVHIVCTGQENHNSLGRQRPLALDIKQSPPMHVHIQYGCMYTCTCIYMSAHRVTV